MGRCPRLASIFSLHLFHPYHDAAPASAGAAAAESARMMSTLERLTKARKPTGGTSATPGGNAGGDALRHFKLLRTRTKALNGGSQRPLGGEDARKFVDGFVDGIRHGGRGMVARSTQYL